MPPIYHPLWSSPSDPIIYVNGWCPFIPFFDHILIYTNWIYIYKFTNAYIIFLLVALVKHIYREKTLTQIVRGSPSFANTVYKRIFFQPYQLSFYCMRPQIQMKLLLFHIDKSLMEKFRPLGPRIAQLCVTICSTFYSAASTSTEWIFGLLISPGK